MRFAVREMRELTGMTLEELSEKSGVPADTIFMMETNSVDRCNSKDIISIAKALEVSADSLFLD